MKRIIAGVALSLLLVTAAKAGVVVGGTRVVYEEGKREASISVTNADTHTPYLVQSWAENFNENDKRPVPFIVTPPLFRLDPEKRNMLRISFTGMELPHDRESVFWLNVKTISPSQKGDVNKLQVNIKSKFKIFYRPADLAGDPSKAWQQLQFHTAGNHLVVNNPTPYYVSLFSVSVAGKEVDEPGMVAPMSSLTWPISGSGTVKWRAINDFGGITDVAQQ
ncbi:molecular chaperone [Pseudocitrobacter sp. RIT415]|uniref:fimbrial biogenesis chaperone n=1 Tax=Pseudocitrobacter TaxID=1504576 RepID=UPI000D3ACF6E|nr:MULTISPECIES: molecular chaperone [Pseudocitrobacter]RAU40254.1 molecular chaperone [Pseudocitrobacter sp. RIT 415]GHD95057.1 fimbrial chaperone protein [Pseudocitrobacter faecalis]